MSKSLTGDLYQLLFSDGKSYIGACSRGAKRRYRDHELEALRGSIGLVHTAWRRLGAPVLIILSENLSVDDLWPAERRTIKKLNTVFPGGYNSVSGRDTAPGGFGNVHSLGTRLQMSLSHIGKKHADETKFRIQQAKLGKRASPSHIESNRRSHTGKKATDQAKLNNSLSQLRRYKENPVSSEECEIRRQRALCWHQRDPNAGMRGKHHKEETKAKLRGQKRSTETKERMRTSALLREARKRELRASVRSRESHD